jgi:hypothetical protein
MMTRSSKDKKEEGKQQVPAAAAAAASHQQQKEHKKKKAKKKNRIKKRIIIRLRAVLLLPDVRDTKYVTSHDSNQNKYFGLNAFDGVPIEGGHAGGRTLPREVQHYSRFCRVVKTVVGIQQNGKTIDNAIKELEPLYSAANKKRSTFVEKLKSKKLVPEKEKGKKGKTS